MSHIILNDEQLDAVLSHLQQIAGDEPDLIQALNHVRTLKGMLPNVRDQDLINDLRAFAGTVFETIRGGTDLDEGPALSLDNVENTIHRMLDVQEHVSHAPSKEEMQSEAKRRKAKHRALDSLLAILPKDDELRQVIERIVD